MTWFRTVDGSGNEVLRRRVVRWPHGTGTECLKTAWKNKCTDIVITKTKKYQGINLTLKIGMLFNLYSTFVTLHNLTYPFSVTYCCEKDQL